MQREYGRGLNGACSVGAGRVGQARGGSKAEAGREAGRARRRAPWGWLVR